MHIYIYIYIDLGEDLLGCSPLCFSISPHRWSSQVRFIDRFASICFGCVTGIRYQTGLVQVTSALYSPG